MGEAIMGGWIASKESLAGCLEASQFVVAECSQERREYLSNRYDVECVEDASYISGQPDVVLLAVKPQVMMDVLEKISQLDFCADKNKMPLFISIAAGLPTKKIEAALPQGISLVRVMPNIPLLVSAGATSVAAGSYASESDVEMVRKLFACLGEAYVIDENLMDATCAVNGSGPAYVAAMIEALRDAGARQGLDSSLAESLAIQTVYGTVELMKQTGQDPEITRLSVCSPGGTTLAALDAMDKAGFAQVFDAGVDAAVRRSKELASC